MLVYKLDILEALREAGYPPTRLRKEKLLGESAIQNLRKGEIVGIITLDKICMMLNMQPGNLLEYIDDKRECVK